jgi:uncharacterized protein
MKIKAEEQKSSQSGRVRRFFITTLERARSESMAPEAMAKGLGIGLFIGFLPLPAFQGLIALAVAHYLGFNRVLAVAGTLVTNWFTMPLVFVGAVWLGGAVLPGLTVTGVVPSSLENLSAVSREILIAYTAGTILLGLLAAGAGYGAMRIYALRRDQRRWKRLEEL